jgi:hypothetical protein
MSSAVQPFCAMLVAAAALTQVQFSNDFDFGAAVGSGFLYTFTLQPIIPFTIVTPF